MILGGFAFSGGCLYLCAGWNLRIGSKNKGNDKGSLTCDTVFVDPNSVNLLNREQNIYCIEGNQEKQGLQCVGSPRDIIDA